MANKKKKFSWQWFAGFVDGDGTIGIYRNGQGAQPYFTAQLVVYNTDLKLLTSLEKELDGYLAETSYNPKTQKPCYQLKWHGKQARDLIDKILPHLRIKQEVAALVLDFPKRRRLGKGKVDHKSLKKQLAIVEKVHTLNKRGI